jgi:hypothetical protein
MAVAGGEQARQGRRAWQACKAAVCVAFIRPPHPSASAPPFWAQYFDVLRDIGLSGKSNTVFMDHTPGALGNVATQIRAGFMQAQAASGQQTMLR